MFSNGEKLQIVLEDKDKTHFFLYDPLHDAGYDSFDEFSGDIFD